jgi:hypothetical protein
MDKDENTDSDDKQYNQLFHCKLPVGNTEVSLDLFPIEL